MMSSGFMTRATVQFSQEDESKENEDQKDDGHSDSNQDGCVVRVGADALGPSSLAVLFATCVCSNLQCQNKTNG